MFLVAEKLNSPFFEIKIREGIAAGKKLLYELPELQLSSNSWSTSIT